MATYYFHDMPSLRALLNDTTINRQNLGHVIQFDEVAYKQNGGVYVTDPSDGGLMPVIDMNKVAPLGVNSIKLAVNLNGKTDITSDNMNTGITGKPLTIKNLYYDGNDYQLIKFDSGSVKNINLLNVYCNGINANGFFGYNMNLSEVSNVKISGLINSSANIGSSNLCNLSSIGSVFGCSFNLKSVYPINTLMEVPYSSGGVYSVKNCVFKFQVPYATNFFYTNTRGITNILNSKFEIDIYENEKQKLTFDLKNYHGNQFNLKNCIFDFHLTDTNSDKSGNFNIDSIPNVSGVNLMISDNNTFDWSTLDQNKFCGCTLSQTLDAHFLKTHRFPLMEEDP